MLREALETSGHRPYLDVARLTSMFQLIINLGGALKGARAARRDGFVISTRLLLIRLVSLLRSYFACALGVVGRA